MIDANGQAVNRLNIPRCPIWKGCSGCGAVAGEDCRDLVNVTTHIHLPQGMFHDVRIEAAGLGRPGWS